MFDNLQLPDNAAEKVVDLVDKHAGETYDLIINQIAKEVGSGFADTIHLFFALPHFLNSPFFKEKAQQFFKELLDKKKQIPDYRLIAPDFQTVSIALEDCRYCITNDELRQMFVNLICNTMDFEYSNKVHPSFPGMIKQMSTLDARILQSFSDDICDVDAQKSIVNRSFALQPVEEIRVIRSDGLLETLFTNMYYTVLPETDYNVYKFSSSITHLEQLGLIKIDYLRCLSEDKYSQLNGRIEEIEGVKSFDPEELEIEKGIAILTPIGQEFLEVCLDSNTSANNAAI